MFIHQSDQSGISSWRSGDVDVMHWMRKGVEGGVVPTTQLVKLAVIWTNTPHYIHLDGGGVDTLGGGWRHKIRCPRLIFDSVWQCYEQQIDAIVLPDF